MTFLNTYMHIYKQYKSISIHIFIVVSIAKSNVLEQKLKLVTHFVIIITIITIYNSSYEHTMFKTVI